MESQYRKGIIYKFIISYLLYQGFMTINILNLKLDFDSSLIKLPLVQCLWKEKYDDDSLQSVRFIDKVHKCKM